ncbi:hypothetical protein [Streptomyces carpinensis]|uniref:Uncharacterized protein n=1 Tax=Streptomyces carpinensis TaxID=66369 RepID=A0ABV1VWC7_9ACTN|nr:hypothetical protein [Streptomyces carpinensis]
MGTPAVVELGSYPYPVWGSAEEGLCARCSEKCKRYGEGANPLCRDCFAVVAAKWGPGVRQKGFNA